MREDMVAGLRIWADSSGGRGQVAEEVDHEGWVLHQVRAGLGVVGFIFEGRPNVVADATGVIRSGNTAVLRIGSAALGTARAIIDHALDPALAEAGVPEGTVSLVDSPTHSAGWAMFSDPRLGLAVARGSGRAVSQLGSVARQTGIPVSLHGSGGAWIVVAGSGLPEVLASAVYHSLDRKVCNTLNTICIVESRAEELVPIVLDGIDRAGERLGTTSKLHVTEAARHLIPNDWFDIVSIERPEGTVSEPRTQLIANEDLGVEWEWEGTPEVTLTVVADVDEAVKLFNEQSPRFAASLISEDLDEQDRFFEMIDAPFVGNGFTRWVDGQYALDRPELGLSNWQSGRLFGRGAILSGDSVHTIRTRVVQSNPDIGR
jgi:glutamate-5-semialdehyde dehydrogenase